MNRNFTWTTSQRGEKAILYNNYLYRLKRKTTIKTVQQFISALSSGALAP